jgi:hypothetical protein
MVQQVQDRIASGAKDKFGATALDVLASIDGSAFCITDAPMNLTLLRSVNSHTSKSVSMGTEDVHEVISMGGKL